MPKEKSLSSGFTLVEMAMVLVVMGLIILAVFPALMAARISSARAATQANLQALLVSTAAYVQANGCLPCPTPAGTTGNGFGVVRGDAGASPKACNNCAAPEGIAPFASLGVPSSTAHDGWGHWITMRVDPALTQDFGVAPPAKPVACPCAGTGSTCTSSLSGCTCATVNDVCTPLSGVSAQGLCAAGLVTANAVQVTKTGGGPQAAAVIFVSHGAHGYGSFIASPTGRDVSNHNGCRTIFPSLPGALCSQTATCAGSSGVQAAECNASGGPQFIDAPQVADYDDMLAFADRNTLVSMLGNGSCQTRWAANE